MSIATHLPYPDLLALKLTSLYFSTLLAPLLTVPIRVRWLHDRTALGLPVPCGRGLGGAVFPSQAHRWVTGGGSRKESNDKDNRYGKGIGPCQNPSQRQRQGLSFLTDAVFVANIEVSDILRGRRTHAECVVHFARARARADKGLEYPPEWERCLVVPHAFTRDRGAHGDGDKARDGRGLCPPIREWEAKRLRFEQSLAGRTARCLVDALVWSRGAFCLDPSGCRTQRHRRAVTAGSTVRRPACWTWTLATATATHVLRDLGRLHPPAIIGCSLLVLVFVALLALLGWVQVPITLGGTWRFVVSTSWTWLRRAWEDGMDDLGIAGQ